VGGVGSEVRDLADDVAVSRIAHGQRRSAADPLTVNVCSLLEKGGIFEQLA
jgi:hypothetical protein